MGNHEAVGVSQNAGVLVVLVDFAVMRLYDIYVYIISVWRRRQKMSLFTGSRVNANY